VSPKLEVAVVGGGWAGLAAAVELAAQGCKVTLFEAAKQLGGRARSVIANVPNGRVLDNGQHILLGAYRETLRLMHIVGADPERTLRRYPLELNYPRAGFRLRLPRLPAPLHLALGLAAASGCSAGEKSSAALFMSALKKTGYRLDADVSVSALLDTHAQRGTLRRLMWEPLCLAALNTPPEKASAQIFANVLRDSLGGASADTDLLLPAVDLDRLFPMAASEFLRARGATVCLSSRIDAIDCDLVLAGRRFDRVILAVGPQHAVKLLASIDATTARMLEAYDYEPITTAYLGYREPVALPFPMLGLDGGIGQWVFDQGALGGPRGVFAFVLSAHGQPGEGEALVAALHEELQEALRTKLAAPEWNFVIREKRAAFTCRPGLPRPAAQSALPGLWLAGDYVCADYPATLEGAVRSGVAAARGIIDEAES
jgi:squalene-associated FAD-dependent desaturase